MPVPVVTKADAERIRRSFATAARDPAALASSFYRLLFAAEPALRPMFPADLAGQQQKLAAMLATAVAHIDDAAVLTPAVEALGRRHQALGVRPDHFPPVGAALVAAIAERTGHPLDTATTTAWTRAFAWLTATMTGAAITPRHGGHSRAEQAGPPLR